MQTSTDVQSPFWTKNYPQGVPETVDLGEKTFIEVVNESMVKFADRDAVECLGAVWTYKRLDEESAQIAASLQNLGLSKGSRVAIMMPTIPQYLVTLLGVFRAGLTAVSVNPLYTPRELDHQLNDSGAEAIFVLDTFAATLEEVLAKTPIKHTVVTSIGDTIGGLKGVAANFVLKNVKKAVPNWNIPTAIQYSAFLNAGKKLTWTPQEHKMDDVAVLQYTGGTTGVAKGAILQQKNILAAAVCSSAWLDYGLSYEPKIENPELLIPLPLYHVFTLYAVSVGIFEGARCIFIPNPRDLDGLVKTMANTRFNLMIGLNTLYAGILAHKDIDKVDFSQSRMFISGGTATHRNTAEKWRELTGQPILEGWGMTETTGAGTCNPYSRDEFSGTVGLPIPSVLISIRNDDGSEVPIGSEGEIWIKGPNVMAGYWNRPEATAEAMDENGFLATGDIGVQDDRGYLKIVDRKKDMILVSGFNVYSNEIENVLSSLEGVSEAAAIGVPDEKSGEAVKVFIIKSDPTLTSDDVKEYCRKELTGYKRPKHIVFVEDLPKSPVGKILRKDLRDN
ncbi:AMP-binding protein [Hirschia maritima]|uniref:AMP-binding protein n=1 Tax=Hirschia maritima TaxID=1121961 RepID=UPI000365137E|nr:AMP-binding protein [Hirschia maritima]